MPIPKGEYPHGDTLFLIRNQAGSKLSMERAAARIGTTRSTWDSWERKGKWPSEHFLHMIVEEFKVPPASVGLEAPRGWELVPAQWLRDEVTSIHDKLDKIIRRQERTK